jgi:hypothetical protein
MLYALAVNGMPVPKEKDEEGEEMEEEGGEMEEEGGKMDFMTAVESAMKKPQPK